MPRLSALGLVPALAVPLLAAPVKILAIGDSLTDEYGAVADLADIPLIAPFLEDSIYPEPANPSFARAFNWPELLTIRRGSEVDFGPSGSWTQFFQGLPIGGDLRFNGYERNFAVVGTTTLNWVTLLSTDSPFDTPGDGFALNSFYYATRSSLLGTIGEADVIVVMLGGNDLKNDYNDLFNATGTPPLLNQIVNRLNSIHGFLRARAPSTPIVVATVPDVGATPNIHDTYNGSPNQEGTRNRIATMNQNIVNTFSAKPDTAVARVDRLTDDILEIVLGIEAGPYDLNGTEFVIDGDPNNPPRYLFCKDDFHPNTVAQALIANEILAAINELIPGSITPFAPREILGSVLGLDPDQPYLDWVAGYPVSDDDPDDDPDDDGLPNLVEMTLGTRPDQASQPFTGSWPGGLSWTPADTRYASLDAEESADLDGWTLVPAGRISSSGPAVTATPPTDADAHFLRLRATPRP